MLYVLYIHVKHGIIINIIGGLFMKKESKIAFTLAEVLITLGIIGVVAAMTIPSLIQSYKEKATVTAVKQNFCASSKNGSTRLSQSTGFN